AHAIKLEGAKGNLDLITHIVDSGIPVMGHIGLTPQAVNSLGGYKVQGKLDQDKLRIFQEAKALEKAGCFAIVLECVPNELAEKITKETDIITVGIGAGNKVDGQVLVINDMLGMSSDFKPKFVRQYLNAENLFLQAFNAFNNDVKTNTFPSRNESYQ
ncbi:MAG: 3-methyl-2-oxobutanoate hydroxymethyltransferase, partial [Marinicellaceae bacterium]